MKEFKTLSEVVEYIREGEKNIDSLVWNNDCGEWDVVDIQTNAMMYDLNYDKYFVDVVSYDIMDEDGYVLFRRVM